MAGFGGHSSKQRTPSMIPFSVDVLATEHEGLLILKLRQCSVVFGFADIAAHAKGEEAKGATLFELVRYMAKGGEIAEPAYPEIVKMISCNLVRSLPPPENPMFDPEEDDPTPEASWPHMQAVYEFFLSFLNSPNFQAKVAKRDINQKFVQELLEMFDSEDRRERFYLKTVLYSVYRKFLGLRAFIRKHISHIILRYVYETERFNGMPELLEILASVISGFALPLKADHRQLLFRVLIPLHKVGCLSACHAQLEHCVIIFLEKDDSLTEMVVNGLLRYWPKTSSQKEILFLNEMKEILVGMSPFEFQKIQNPLFRQIARCVSSPHFQVCMLSHCHRMRRNATECDGMRSMSNVSVFLPAAQVAESAICLWRQDRITTLIKGNYLEIMPIVFPALYGISKEHLSLSIVDLVRDVLQTFMERQPLLCDELATVLIPQNNTPFSVDVLATEHEGLLILKLRQCSVVFDIADIAAHAKGEEAKGATLFELVRYMAKGGEIAESAYPEIAKMISCNLLRSLPPPENPIFDPEEDEPVLEASWPHLQAVYIFFLSFLDSPNFQVNVAKRDINQKFLLEMFDSEDPRERFYLKTVLYNVYRKFVGLRSFIRKHITHIILSVINGFALPLKADQKQLLLKVLIPLHKVRYLSTCHPQLQHCIFQFLEKDDSLTEMVIVGLLRYWPKTSSQKEILFLNEVQEILVGISPYEFQKIQNPLFRQIARCVSSPHYQVAECAICLWHRDRIMALIKGNYLVIMPIVFPALYGISKEHLSPPVVDLVKDVLQTFMERQPLLCDELATSFRAERQ
ncbi:unnamed protein product [Darwinula stevensoni]|uniref:Serine/threonine protein phosphatase 2A regulatory subunit n=1 Tax=Darwinula stevensoni TaxID=69355 RepID=A0A7R9FS50_9CRUS|nr:unnamed protein product [Darwinula stevensoni]CAG0902582.1 unnamed protein product [Darwinula stevensoni]